MTCGLELATGSLLEYLPSMRDEFTITTSKLNGGRGRWDYQNTKIPRPSAVLGGNARPQPPDTVRLLLS